MSPSLTPYSLASDADIGDLHIQDDVMEKRLNEKRMSHHIEDTTGTCL
jgi:hypothetical protein